MSTTQLTMTPADLFKYQNDLVRTGKHLPRAACATIAVGPCDTYKPPADDPIITATDRSRSATPAAACWIFSGQWLPIAQAATSP